MADKKAYTIRIDTDLLDKVKAAADDRGDTVTDTIESALKSHLNISTDKPDLHNIDQRLRALEAKFGDTQKEPAPSVNPNELGDLISMNEIAEITGYKKSSLSSKLSRQGIQAVKRIDGNRGGLYSKEEVLQKIGIRK